jgi:hypothetical protein
MVDFLLDILDYLVIGTIIGVCIMAVVLGVLDKKW